MKNAKTFLMARHCHRQGMSNVSNHTYTDVKQRIKQILQHFILEVNKCVFS